MIEIPTSIIEEKISIQYWPNLGKVLIVGHFSNGDGQEIADMSLREFLHGIGVTYENVKEAVTDC
jgi:hypothetical protein